MRSAGILALSLVCCGGEDVDVTRIRLELPRSLDPSLVQSVEIAAIHEPTVSCVSAEGSNRCATLESVEQAKEAQGFCGEQTITRAGGSSTATFAELDRGRTCFIAQASSINGSNLGVGCAEVDLALEVHKIEILIDGD